MKFQITKQQLEADKARFGSQASIARHYGVSRAVICLLAQQHGVPFRKWPPEQREAASVRVRAANARIREDPLLNLQAAMVRLTNAVRRLVDERKLRNKTVS